MDDADAEAIWAAKSDAELVEASDLTLTSQPILFDGKTRVFRAIWKRNA